MFNLLRLCCIALLVSFVLAGCSNPEKKKEKHYARALEYINQEDSNSAIIELRNAIDIDPKFSDARYQLGLLYLKNGDAKAAFGELQRSVTLDPSNLDAGVKVAEFYLMAKKKEETRKYLSTVLEKDPSYLDGIALLANVELIDGNFEAAKAALEKATGPEAESDRFYNIRGRLAAAQKDFVESERMFIQAIELGPENLSNYRTLLLLYQQQKLSDNANELAEKIESNFGDKPQALLVLSSYYNAVQDKDRTEATLIKLVELNPEEVRFRLMLSSFYRQQKDLEKAATALTEALEVLPDSNDLKAALADILFNQRKIDETQQLVDEVLASNDAHKGATFVKGKLLLAGGKNQEALETFTVLTKDYPKWADPHYHLALCHLKLGEIELAQQMARKALQLSPANSQFHALQAQLFLMQGDAVNAGKEATIALKLNPRNYVAVRFLAKALLLDKRFEDAVKLITDVQKQVSGDPDMIGSLGLAYVGLKDRDKALETFTQLLEKVPGNSRALAMAASLSAEGDIEKAIAMVQEQITKSPETASHYMLLGDLQLRAKKPEDALTTFAKAQELAPNNPQPYIIRGRLMHRLGRTEEAVTEFKGLLAKDPNSVPANLGLATIFESQEKFTDAKTIYQKVLEVAPDQPTAANNMAYIMLSEEGGDLGEALRLAMMAKQALPDDPRIADTLGMVHLKRESYGLATTQFQQALNERADDPIINYHMAMAQYGKGEKEEALGFLQKAVSSEVEFGERGEAEKLLGEWKGE
ncbi:tetratricopeptide repeat protein [Desulfopila sp. IMCC35008]|uniref:tetratricopeptide repeat protein n=1 Tax=Desulfopila sp. IMCC35008 TaxID=2653858 RepID=UPI0013D22805|nr:tetratricopeptide repeat protein [Desulfopila sp. IMCC35008]